MEVKQETTVRDITAGTNSREFSCHSQVSTTLFAVAAANIRSRRCMTQNFRLICLDVHTEESIEDSWNSISHLRYFVNTIDTFTDADECVDFLTDIEDENVFMIISDTLGQNVVPFIHETPQLDSIYVFWDGSSCNEQWAIEWWKVKGVFTQITCIYDSMQQATRRCNRNAIPMSFVSVSELSNPNLDQLDPSFMHTQLLKETLLEIHDYNSNSIKEFADYCRAQYAENQTELENIAKFEREYNLQTPIWWYTFEIFLYSMLNRSLRTLEVDIILKMAFFIHDLHQHIEQLHSEQSSNHRLKFFIVYRGQGLSKVHFEKLKRTSGGLMSFNNFLSTSTNREVAFAFAESNGSRPDMIGVLFEIAIDQSISSAPFTFLGNVSNFPIEDEVLFSMNTVFRIGDIKQMDSTNKQFWQVKLTLTNDNDKDLNALTDLLRQELSKSTEGWSRLGSLLIKLGQFDKAEQLYEALLDQAPEKHPRIHYYDQLGKINFLKCDYEKALSFVKQALEIFQDNALKTMGEQPFDEIIQKLFSPDLVRFVYDIPLIKSIANDPSKALAVCEKLKQAEEQCSFLNDSRSISTNNLPGYIYLRERDYSKAISYYEKELEIHQLSLPRNHPSLAALYSGVGTAYCGMGDYSKALSNYQKAFEIREKSLPLFHSDLGSSNNNIGVVYFEMGDYSKALSYCEKAIEIWQKSLPPDHHDLTRSYNNVGYIYENMDDYSKALSFYERAIEMRQKSLCSEDLDLANSNNNIGVVYFELGEYSKALSYCKKALEIWQKSLSPDDPSLALAYNNIRVIYENMDDYSTALPFYEMATKMRQKSLSSEDLDSASSCRSIGMRIKWDF